MDKLEFRILEKVNDVNLFIDKVENYTNVRLPISYVKGAKIVGVFSQGKIVAGYMLVTTPNLRSLLFVPDRVKQESNFFKKDRYDMMEVNGLWISPAVKSPEQQFTIWMRLIKDIFVSKKNYLLLMSDSRNKNIEYLHKLTKPTFLYEGSPQLMAGDKTHREIQVSYTTRWNLVVNSHKYILELWNRKRRASAYAKHRNIVRTLKGSEANYV